MGGKGGEVSVGGSRKERVWRVYGREDVSISGTRVCSRPIGSDKHVYNYTTERSEA